ncbi:MAG: hypothetical protein Kapaf2KO_07440 [Candidatus Kapaibacteriales bacterium]
MIKGFLKVDYFINTVLVFAFLAFLPWFFSIDFFDPLQNTIEDMKITDIVFSHIRDKDDFPPDTNIILINNSHLSRGSFAEELETIASYEPKVIGIDAMYRKKKDPDEDAYLSYVFSEIENLVIVCGLDKPLEDRFDTLNISHPIFSDNAKLGYANIIESDEDFKTVRLSSPSEFVKDSLHISFPVSIAGIYAPEKARKYLERDNDREIVNYKRNIWDQGYRSLDVMDIFNNPDTLEMVRDKIVLIGYLGPTLNTLTTEDIFFSPLNKDYVGRGEPDMYGVVIHANVISQILEEDFLNMSPEWLPYLVMVLVVFFNIVVFDKLRENFPVWSQFVTIGFVFSELIILPLIVIVSLHYLSFELDLGAVFFAIIVSIICFELYRDSLKPLFFRFVFKNPLNKIKG